MKQDSVLVLGAGLAREQRIRLTTTETDTPGSRPFEDTFSKVIYVDIQPANNPTVVWDLNKFPWPFEDGEFDQVHAYEVLEHLGEMGDPVSFFALWREIWRVLRPGGLLVATVPWWDGPWAWADPGHVRVYSANLLTYLCREWIDEQLGRTSITNYPTLWPKPYTFQLVYDNASARATACGYSFIMRKGFAE